MVAEKVTREKEVTIRRIQPLTTLLRIMDPELTPMEVVRKAKGKMTRVKIASPLKLLLTLARVEAVAPVLTLILQSKLLIVV